MAVNLDQTPKKIEDTVRKAPANQGKNEADMWDAIDTAVAAAVTATTINAVETYTPAPNGNKRGRK